MYYLKLTNLQCLRPLFVSFIAHNWREEAIPGTFSMHFEGGVMEANFLTAGHRNVAKEYAARYSPEMNIKEGVNKP